MKKKQLRGWVVKILEVIIGTYAAFIMVSIEGLGHPLYNLVFTVWTALAVASYVILVKYSKVFD